MAQDWRHSFGVKFFGGDHADFVLAREVEVIFTIDLAAKADLQDATIRQKTFFEGAAEGRAVRILAAEIFVPEIVVSVELDQADGPAVLFGDGAKDGKADRVIAADADGARSGVENGGDSLLDTAERVFDGKRIDGEVAEIRDAVFGKGIQV